LITEQQLRAMFPSVPPQKYNELRSHLYEASDGTLSVVASRVHMLAMLARGVQLPTCISSNALDVLEGLRELLAAGVVSISGMNLHDNAPGVRLQQIEETK
jgi:hypothetical protein